MRWLYLVVFLCFNILVQAQNKDKVLFTVNGEDVFLSEFQYIYEKNNSKNADYSKESVEEYLELYKKFKLKVHKAREEGLDTVRTLKEELSGYRKQLAQSYLKDREINNRLIEEVVERMKEDIEVSHIFVSAEDKASELKKESAKSKITEIHKKLGEGQPFDLIAQSLSEDRSSKTRAGYLGYYTAPLPNGFYAFENAMYNTEVGDYSEVVKSKMGYHIIKVTKKRPSRGQVEVAHILLRKKPKERPNNVTAEIADSVYQLILQGRNFENMAGKFSEDSKTKAKGGYLGYLAINQFDIKFEDAAFALEENGQFSAPVETEIGYHIIKRINKRDDSNPELLKKRVKAQISNDDRFQIAQENLIKQVKVDAKFKENKEVLDEFVKSLDETFFSYKWKTPLMENNPTLFELDGIDYSLMSFAKFVKNSVKDRLRFNRVKSYEAATMALYDSYVNQTVMAYEEKNLEVKYPEFKSLMREYREGILLFEITKNKVWDKASQDTTGLQAYFADNASNYMWTERVKVMHYEIDSKDEKAAISIYKYAQKKEHDKVQKKYDDVPGLTLTVNELIMDKADKRILEMQLKDGGMSPLKMDKDSAHFYKYAGMMEPEQKTLDEARGYVIADYQDFLESEWVEQLASEYPIKVNKSVLKSIIKD